MKEKTILNKLRVLLGMEVKLEQMKLTDGETIIEADNFETAVYDNQKTAPQAFIVTTDEQKIPLPVGEYEMEDGRVLVVTQEGVIAEIKEIPATEEQAPEEQVAPEVPVEASTNPAPTKEPKSIIESTTREVRFSDEEKEKLANVMLSGALSISAYLELPAGVHKIGNDTITVAEKDVPNWDGKGTHKERYIVSIIPDSVNQKMSEMETKLSEVSSPIVFNPENKKTVEIDLSKADKRTRLIHSLNNL